MRVQSVEQIQSHLTPLTPIQAGEMNIIRGKYVGAIPPAPTLILTPSRSKSIQYAIAKSPMRHEMNTLPTFYRGMRPQDGDSLLPEFENNIISYGLLRPRISRETPTIGYAAASIATRYGLLRREIEPMVAYFPVDPETRSSLIVASEGVARLLGIRASDETLANIIEEENRVDKGHDSIVIF